MMKLIGVLLTGGLLLNACNSEQKNIVEDAQETLTEAASSVREVAQLETVELKEQLQDMSTMLREKMKEVDEQLAEAKEEKKIELEASKKQIMTWNNKIGLQLQKLGGDMSNDWETFKVESEKLFEEIGDHFKDDRNEL